MDPLLEEVPDRVETDTLILRCPRASDAEVHNAAVVGSIDDLRVYLPWAQETPTLAQSAANLRRMQAKFLLREDLPFLVFDRRPDGGEGGFIGGTGLHRIDWNVRRFEVGYWCRMELRRRGHALAIVQAMTRLALETLQARRVEIRVDTTNEASWRVAERAAFRLEGVLQHDALTPAGVPRDTRVYARVAEAH